MSSYWPVKDNGVGGGLCCFSESETHHEIVLLLEEIDHNVWICLNCFRTLAEKPDEHYRAMLKKTISQPYTPSSE